MYLGVIMITMNGCEFGSLPDHRVVWEELSPNQKAGFALLFDGHGLGVNDSPEYPESFCGIGVPAWDSLTLIEVSGGVGIEDFPFLFHTAQLCADGRERVAR